MIDTESKPKNMSIGKKISRIRELRGIKQEALATEMGVSQQFVSKLEQSENVEDETLERVAQVLGVSAEAIKNYSDEAVINIISSTVHNTNGLVNYNPTFTFNPVEKIVELYERLLQAEKDKNELLKGRIE